MATLNRLDRVALTLGNRELVLLAVAVALLLTVTPFVIDQGMLTLLIEVGTLIAMVQMWNLLAGFAGLVSMGHQVFVGLGAYTLFFFSNATGISPYWSLVSAPIVCGLFAAIIAPMLLRLRDAHFAIGMWVLAEMVAIIVSIVPWFGRSYGITLFGIGDLDREWFIPICFWLSGFLALASVMLSLVLLRSRVGLGLMAVRDNEVAAAALGVNVWASRLLILVISGAGTGLAGAVYYLSAFQVVPSSAFNPNWAVLMLFITIIGGVGNLVGPLVGIILYFAIREIFVDAGNWTFIVLGAMGSLIMLVAPKGLWGSLAARFGLDLLTVRRRPQSARLAHLPGKSTENDQTS